MPAPTDTAEPAQLLLSQAGGYWLFAVGAHQCGAGMELISVAQQVQTTSEQLLPAERQEFNYP